MITTDVSIRLLYLTHCAIEGLKVARENMDIAEQSLRTSARARGVGASAQINIIQAQVDVESNREQLILAEASISHAEDILRTLILDPARPDYWEVQLEPTDTIMLTPREIDLNAAIKNALANRLDLTIARRNLEITDLNIRVTRTRPAGARFRRNYRAAARVASSGRSRAPSSAASAACSATRSAASIRPGRSACSFVSARPTAAHATLAQQVQKRTGLELRELELAVVGEVRDAARHVQNSYQRVQATQAALDATEQQLEAEERRFAVGLSPRSTCRSGRRSSPGPGQRLNARIDYNRALITFERVQKTQ